MKNVLELLYDHPGKTYEQDSPFVRTARIKNELMEMLTDGMTDEQKELLDACFEADARNEGTINFEQFRYAFHLGAELMAELTEGRDEVLGLHLTKAE